MLWKQTQPTVVIGYFGIVDIIGITRSSIPEGRIKNAAYFSYPSCGDGGTSGTRETCGDGGNKGT